MIRSRMKAFSGPGADERAEKVGHYLKAMAGNDASRKFCVDRGIGLVRATGESGNTVGGFLAPQDFDAAIIAIRETVGAFRQGAETRPSSSDNQVRPRRVGGVTANFVGEGAPIPESQLQFDAVETTQKKLAVLCRGSAELFEDSAADLAEFITTEIAYAFAATEDDCGFNGTGTSTFSGISGLAMKLVGMKSAVAAASGHNTFLTIDTTDITNLMAGVLATAIPGSAFYTKRDRLRTDVLPHRGGRRWPCGQTTIRRHDQRELSWLPGKLQRQAAGCTDHSRGKTDAVFRQSGDVQRDRRAPAANGDRDQSRSCLRRGSSPGPWR
jgi:HK97 family phage major capsid protein